MFSGLPHNHFKAIIADPPWRFNVRSAKGEGRTPQNHYETMLTSDIAAMNVADVCANDCYLFMWATWPHLRQAFDVMDAWGFEYSGSGFVWIKQRRSFHADQFSMLDTEEGDLQIGLGYSTRKNSEPVLLGRRGSPKRKSAAIREVIIAPAREHSRKPEEFYRRVEEFCDGPYLEMFARQQRAGDWTVWGNQTDKFKTAPPEFTGGGNSKEKDAVIA